MHAFHLVSLSLTQCYSFLTFNFGTIHGICLLIWTRSIFISFTNHCINSLNKLSKIQQKYFKYGKNEFTWYQRNKKTVHKKPKREKNNTTNVNFEWAESVAGSTIQIVVRCIHSAHTHIHTHTFFVCECFYKRQHRNEISVWVRKNAKTLSTLNQRVEQKWHCIHFHNVWLPFFAARLQPFR